MGPNVNIGFIEIRSLIIVRISNVVSRIVDVIPLCEVNKDHSVQRSARFKI